jgi:hypothetical protein
LGRVVGKRPRVPQLSGVILLPDGLVEVTKLATLRRSFIVDHAHHPVLGRLAAPPAHPADSQPIQVDDELGADRDKLGMLAGQIRTLGELEHLAEDVLLADALAVGDEGIDPVGYGGGLTRLCYCYSLRLH